MVNRYNLAYASFLPPTTVTFYSVPVFPFNSERSSGLFYLSRYFSVYIHRLIVLQLHQSVAQVIKTIVFNSTGIFLCLVMTHLSVFYRMHHFSEGFINSRSFTPGAFRQKCIFGHFQPQKRILQHL